MLDTIGAFGSGIGTNLLSDSLSKKLEAFKDKKAIASFTQSLRDWEIEFEKQNDGTIITNGAFYSHVKYHNVIENIVAYVLEPSMNAVTEDEFLNCLHEKMVNRIEETTEKKLSWNDSRLIRNFLTHLLTTTRAFLFQKISLEDRGLFYLVCQNNAKLEHLERIVKEKFQMQDQNVQQIVEQLSMAIQKSETEERIKAKMASWNSRQIKNLGNRYTPDLNIPVEIMDSLHGASVDQQFQNIFYDKVDKFLIAMRHTELSEINALCDAIEKYAIELNFFNITSSDIDVIISTVNANDTGFYIRYDKLLEFLKSSSYTLVWTSLCEKRILTPSFGKWDLPPKAIHMSSVYYLKDGKIAKASETLFEDRLYY